MGGGQEVTCDYFEYFEWCKDGSLNDEVFGNGDYKNLLQRKDNGRTIEQVCCSCGGGTGTDDNADRLRQW
jgi:hypothetical protein